MGSVRVGLGPFSNRTCRNSGTISAMRPLFCSRSSPARRPRSPAPPTTQSSTPRAARSARTTPSWPCHPDRREHPAHPPLPAPHHQRNRGGRRDPRDRPRCHKAEEVTFTLATCATRKVATNAPDTLAVLIHGTPPAAPGCRTCSAPSAAGAPRCGDHVLVGGTLGSSTSITRFRITGCRSRSLSSSAANHRTSEVSTPSARAVPAT
jgi:hypothetical protein